LAIWTFRFEHDRLQRANFIVSLIRSLFLFCKTSLDFFSP
jgi:hypothetical protein